MRPIPKFILAATCLSIGASQPAQSQTVFTWTGAAGTGWNTADNWINGVPVSAIDTALVFDSLTQPVTSNNLPGGLTLNSFTLSPDAGLRTFSGNELRFAGVDPELIDLVATGPVTLALPIVLNETLSVASGPSLSSQLFLDGAVSGAGGLVFRSGFGNLRGSNMYTGATNVEGTASLGAVGSNALGASTIVTVASGAELQIIRFNEATSTTINRPLSLAGALTSPSKKIPSFFGAVSSAQYSGSITLTGNAEIRAFNGVGEGTNSVEFKISGAIDRAGNDLQIATTGQFNTVTVGSPISGNGNLTLRPEGGTIALSTVTGDGDVSVAGADTGGTVTLDSLTGAGNFDVSPSGTFGRVTVAGAIVGNRNISLTSGQLRLNSAASTFTGSITLSGLGILSIDDQSRLGNAANTIQFNGGGGLSLTGDGEFSRPITITGGRASIETNFLSRTISAPITGTGELELSNGLVTLSGANSFQGGLLIGANMTVLYAADANLGAAGGGLTLNGGSLALPAGVGTFGRPIAVTSSNGSISGASGDDVVLAGNLSGPGLLTLGAAKFSITGTNTNSGGLAVVGNVEAPASLAIDSDARLGVASAVLNLGRQNGLAVLPGELKALGDLTIAATRSTSFRNMTVNTNGHSVVFNQPIAGRGIVKQGEGVWTLNTVNSDASGNNEVTIEKGTLRIGIANALGSRANINSIADGGSLDLGSTDLELLRLTNVAPGAEIKLGTGTLALRTAADISGIITGAGSVVLGVPGFSSQGFVFAGQNSFSGGLTIQAGARLSVQHPQALGSAANPITLDGGALGITSQAAAPLTIDATTPLIIGSGGAEFVADGQSILISSQLTGTNPIRFSGGSEPAAANKYDVRLLHANNTFAGPVELASAIIGIVANGSLGDATNVVTMGASTFDGEVTRSSRGGFRAYDDLTLPASRAVRLDGFLGDPSSSGGIVDTNGHVVTIQGAISELESGMPLLKTGLGALLLNGGNIYTGTTEIAEGILGGNGTIQALSVSSGGTLAPGVGAGSFTIVNAVEFFSGALAIELGGTAQGSEYDRLLVGGSMLLGNAQLVLSFINSFENRALSSDVFILAEAGSISGSFANAASGSRLSTVDGFGSFLVSYGQGSAFNADAVVLSEFAAVPEPSAAILCIAGMVSVTLRRRRPSYCTFGVVV